MSFNLQNYRFSICDHHNKTAIFSIFHSIRHEKRIEKKNFVSSFAPLGNRQIGNNKSPLDNM